MQARELRGGGGDEQRNAKNIFPEDEAKTAEAAASKTQQH